MCQKIFNGFPNEDVLCLWSRLNVEESIVDECFAHVREISEDGVDDVAEIFLEFFHQLAQSLPRDH